MKIKCLAYLLLLIITPAFLLTSCDGDDVDYTKNVEGHWVYAETKADVYVTDSTLTKEVKEYIENRHKSIKVSYEFKNDRTYYFYQNYEEPLKGIYKIVDKDYYMIDDMRGIKTVTREDANIYIVSDMRKEIVKELGIDSNKLVKAIATDTFERGLFSE